MYRVLLVYIGDLKQQYLLFYCVYVCVCLVFFLGNTAIAQNFRKSNLDSHSMLILYRTQHASILLLYLYQYYRRSRVWTYIIVLVFLLYCVCGGGGAEFRTLNKRVHAFLFFFANTVGPSRKYSWGFYKSNINPKIQVDHGDWMTSIDFQVKRSDHFMM